MSMDGALEENKDGDVVIIDDDSDDAQSALPSPPASLSSQSKRSINRGKSIAEMLGIDTTNKKKKHPNVPVVIDPRLSKILRPHQVEGVKLPISAQQVRLCLRPLDVLWQMKWV